MELGTAPCSADGRPLTFEPDEETLAELWRAWDRLLRPSLRPVLFTVIGDVFLSDDENGAVFWLNCGAGELTSVAESIKAFETRLVGDEGRYWLLPDLVDELGRSGQVLGPGQGFMWLVLPIFKECQYAASNLRIVPIKALFGYSGDLHRQLVELSDGATVRIVVE